MNRDRGFPGRPAEAAEGRWRAALRRLRAHARTMPARLPLRTGAWLPAARREAALLAALALAAASLALFAQLTDEVLEGETHAFDKAILLALRSATAPSDPLGPDWFTDVMRDFTALGSLSVLTFLSLAVVGFLLLQGKGHLAVLVVAAVGGGMLVSTLTKLGFDRPRPDLVPHAVQVHTASFPSGHAMMAAVTYLTLGALLARAQPRRRLKLYLVGLAATLTVLIGLSRIYLGVHWPTDVLAGWSLGAAWALGCWTIALWLQARGRVEADEPVGEPAERPRQTTAADRQQPARLRAPQHRTTPRAAGR
ncbi:MAG TPA: phosphatase PAP2 family protein [Geminicoccaceae bacterium]|nr:phosphatase PAP2 family protein [Geminicoccaceae bacterium]